MLYYLGGLLAQVWGPARLLQSYAVLIIIALYGGFIITKLTLPLFYNVLPHDRGRDFTLTKEAAMGKPTGSGVVFITYFVILTFIIFPLTWMECAVLGLTWVMMLTGYLDDRSEGGWGEYIKAFLDLVVCVGAAFVLYYGLLQNSTDGNVSFWFPFITHTVAIPMWLYVMITTVLLWVSINTTNCTDGVDGLSSTLVLFGLFTMAVIFYVVLGHVDIATYLLVPHLTNGAIWGAMTFSLSGVLMGYLWHNAFPSKVLMGDAGSRALGFFIGVCVMVSGNPLMFLATSSIIFVNGGMGLLKVALKRFLHISIFENIRFPLHDHMRKNRGWSPTQVLLKFLMIQILITIAMLGIFFKIR